MATAVITSANGLQVAVVGEDDTVHYRKVQVGRDYGTEVEIVSGLSGNETVVVNASKELDDGSAVQKKENSHAQRTAGGKS